MTRKKSPIVYKSCPKMISLEKWMILTTLHKLPKNVGDLGKSIVAKGFKNGPKSNKSPNLVTLLWTLTPAQQHAGLQYMLFRQQQDITVSSYIKWNKISINNLVFIKLCFVQFKFLTLDKNDILCNIISFGLLCGCFMVCFSTMVKDFIVLFLKTNFYD